MMGGDALSDNKGEDEDEDLEFLQTTTNQHPMKSKAENLFSNNRLL